MLGDADLLFVECLWHGGRFDLRTGEVLEGPCSRALGVYACGESDGAIYLVEER